MWYLPDAQHVGDSILEFSFTKIINIIKISYNIILNILLSKIDIKIENSQNTYFEGKKIVG